MSTYLLAYRAPKNYQGSPETGATWATWFEHIGANLVERGHPVFERSTLGDCGPGSATELGGYSLVTAEDLSAAVTLAKGCPILAVGGGVEVGELTFLDDGLLTGTEQ
jgi:hypothetical protein